MKPLKLESLVLAAALALASCATPLNTSPAPVSSTPRTVPIRVEVPTTKGSMAPITTVTVRVFDPATGATLTSGTLTQATPGTGPWTGDVTLSSSIPVMVGAWAWGGRSAGTLAFVGRQTISLTGTGDAVTITLQPVSAKSGTIQGRPLGFTSATAPVKASLLAGNGAYGTPIDAVGTAAEFGGPYDMICDGALLWVADGIAGIRRVDLTTGAVTTLNTSASGVNFVSGAANAPDLNAITEHGGTLYVAASFDNKIYRVAKDGSSVVVVATAPGAVNAEKATGDANDSTYLVALGTSLYGVYYDASGGNLYRVDLSTTPATVTTLGAAALHLGSVDGLTTDGTDLLVACNPTVVEKLLRVTIDGSSSSVLASYTKTNYLQGLTYDGTNLWSTTDLGTVVPKGLSVGARGLASDLSALLRIPLADPSHPVTVTVGLPSLPVPGSLAGGRLVSDGVNLYCCDYEMSYLYQFSQ